MSRPNVTVQELKLNDNKLTMSSVCPLCVCISFCFCLCAHVHFCRSVCPPVCLCACLSVRSAQTSLRQMNQTRMYMVERRNSVVQVSLMVGGLPMQLCREEYADLLQEHLAIKSESLPLQVSLTLPNQLVNTVIILPHGVCLCKTDL